MPRGFPCPGSGRPLSDELALTPGARDPAGVVGDREPGHRLDLSVGPREVPATPAGSRSRSVTGAGDDRLVQAGEGQEVSDALDGLNVPTLISAGQARVGDG